MVELGEAVLLLQTRSEVDDFLAALLSPAEITAVERRWSVFQMLLDGMPQREVKTISGTAIATVSRASRQLSTGKGVFKTIRRRVADQGFPP